MVARMMETIRTKDPFRISRFFPRVSLLTTARCAAMELYTCRLGKIFVEVSIWYKMETANVKILFRVKPEGRSRCPFGYMVETIRNSVIPVNRKIQYR